MSEGIKKVIEAENSALKRIEEAKEIIKQMQHKAQKDAKQYSEYIEIEMEKDLKKKRKRDNHYLENLNKTLQNDLSEKLEKLKKKNINTIIENIIDVITDKDI